MDQQGPLNSESDRALERALGELVVRPARLDRDRLMFEAGRQCQRSTRTRHWIWPASTACSSAAALVLLVLYTLQGEPATPGPRSIPPLAKSTVEKAEGDNRVDRPVTGATAERLVQREASAESSPTTAAPPADMASLRLRFRPLGAPEESLFSPRYDRLRDVMLRPGLEGNSLRQAAVPPAAPTPASYREERQRYLDSTRSIQRPATEATQVDRPLPIS